MRFRDPITRNPSLQRRAITAAPTILSDAFSWEVPFTFSDLGEEKDGEPSRQRGGGDGARMEPFVSVPDIVPFTVGRTERGWLLNKILMREVTGNFEQPTVIKSHGDLDDLNGVDDHDFYYPVDGSRGLSGDFNLGTSLSREFKISGNKVLTVSHVTNAVPYVKIRNGLVGAARAGTGPQIEVLGGNADLRLEFAHSTRGLDLQTHGIFNVADPTQAQDAATKQYVDDTVAGGGAGTDTTAIHDNVAAELSIITEKGTPISGDLLLIEDSADSNNKKFIQIGNLPSGAGALSDLSDVDSAAQTDGFVIRSVGGNYAGAQLSHTKLGDIGTKTHATIDTHVDATSDPHSSAMAVSVSVTTPKVYGGTAAGSALTLESTSHGTPSADYLAFRAAGTEVGRWDGDEAALKINHSQALRFAGDKLDIRADNLACSMSIMSNRDNANQSASVRMQRSHGTIGSETNVISGDSLANFIVYGYHTGWHSQRGQILFKVDGTPSSTSMPTSIEFRAGTTSATTRLIIGSDGTSTFFDTLQMNAVLQMDVANKIQFNGSNNFIYGPSTAILAVEATYNLQLRAGAANSISHIIGGSTDMLHTENELQLVASGTAIKLDWGTSSTFKLLSGTTTRFSISDVGIGFYATAPVARPDVTGSRGGNAALADLLTDLATLGLIRNSTTA